MRALALVALAACGGFADSGNPSFDGGAGGDAPVGCQVTLSFDPNPPHAGATISGTASVTNPGGVLTYTWDVRYNNAPVTLTPASSNNSTITFFAQDAGTYVVNVQVTGGNYCEPALDYLDVLAPNAMSFDYRLHAFPPAQLAPPQDTIIEVDGGANAYMPVALQPGIQQTLTLTDGINPVSGYVRFISSTSPTAYVEAYAGADGVVNARVLGQPYGLLVVPSTSAVAPALVNWSPNMTQVVVPAGSLVSGSVLDPGGAALAGAIVQLTANGVPSTIATTASDGSFSVRTSFPVGSQVTADITPPAGRGLPRLQAVGTLDLSKPLHVAYAASLATTCDLSGTAVQRQSANQPGALVTVVGAIASAGTLTAGTTSATATGAVQIGATADGTGKLPSTIVPRAMLSAVVEIAPGDRAAAALDTTTCSATTIAAPLGPTAAGGVTDSLGHLLAGVRVQASPTRALAQAGIAATETMTDSTGQFSLPLAAGGYYDVRFVDPLGRAAMTVVPDIAATAIPTSQALPKALQLSGKVSVVGNPNPVEGAAIQLLCISCSGLAVSQPIADTATDANSMFVLAVPDPGTM